MNSLKQKLVTFGITTAAVSYGYLVPFLVSAQTTPGSRSIRLNNPLRVDNITDLLEALLSIVLVLATPIIIFFIIYAGFLYVTAQGNAEQVKQATRSLTYAIIGGVIIIGAMAIATIVKNLVGAF